MEGKCQSFHLSVFRYVHIVLRFTETRDFRYEVCQSLWGLNESWNSREFALPPNFPRVEERKKKRKSSSKVD